MGKPTHHHKWVVDHVNEPLLDPENLDRYADKLAKHKENEKIIWNDQVRKSQVPRTCWRCGLEFSKNDVVWAIVIDEAKSVVDLARLLCSGCADIHHNAGAVIAEVMV